MNKFIFLLTSLFFASIATADNEAAVYDAETGVVKIPALSIKGQSEKFSAILQQQDAENLIFKLTDTMQESLEVSSAEVTYDPKTGTVIIPTLIILEKEGAAAQYYSVELQETGEKVFEVTKIQDKSELPINNFKARRSPPPPSHPYWIREWCTGAPSQDIYVARKKFRSRCGVSWDYKRHVCNYKPDGYHCNGVVSRLMNDY